MNIRPEQESSIEAERDRHALIDAQMDARWHPVYAAVVIYTVLLITALWGFSRLFSP